MFLSVVYANKWSAFYFSPCDRELSGPNHRANQKANTQTPSIALGAVEIKNDLEQVEIKLPAVKKHFAQPPVTVPTM